jgi:replicative DNA helicase
LFLAEAADTLRVDPHLLQSAGVAPGGSLTDTPPGQLSMREKLEGQFLSLLLNSHDALDEVFEAVSPDDFDSKQLSRLYLAMARQYGEIGRLEATSLIDLLADDEAVGRLSEIASIDWPPDQVASELRVFVTEFIQRKQKRIRNRLQRELAEAEAAGDNEKASELLQLIRRYGL